MYRALFCSHSWHIVSINHDLPSSPPKHIFEAVIDWKYEQFLSEIRRNTSRGLSYVAERGCLPVGQPCKGYRLEAAQIGTSRDGTPRLGRKPVVDPAVAPLIKRAFKMKARGMSIQEISQKTGLYPPGSGSWTSFFRNRAYIGEYWFQGKVFTKIYPAIVARHVFDAVQRIMERNQSRKAGNSSREEDGR